MDIRRRTPIIEAYKFSGDSHIPNWPKNWLSHEHKYIFKDDHESISIENNGKWLYADRGDWIIKDEKGEFFPVTSAKFRKEFMPA